MTTTQAALERALQSLAPVHMELLNESHMHAVPPGSESHFKLVIVSQEFEGLNAVKRHQAVYRTLGDLMQQIHALALHTYSPAEWQARAPPDSLACRAAARPTSLPGPAYLAAGYFLLESPPRSAALFRYALRGRSLNNEVCMSIVVALAVVTLEDFQSCASHCSIP